MAIVKLGGIVTEISGKIGGQSFSNYGSFATLKNITQRNTLPSSKQARQRFITGQISGSWAQLTQAQRDGWETASVNYTWYNKIGVEVTRNGFQTFNFLNQNLTLIGIAPNVNAPAYVPVTQPKINIIDISSGNFEIQSNNSSATYLYALFAAPNLPNGVSYAQNRMKYCGTITSAQLNAGYDVIADIEAVFGNLAFPNKISIIIDPINQTTGNRSQYVTEILNIDTPMIIEVTVADGNSITIPFASGGTYAGTVDFGDGTVNIFSAFNSAGLTHVYVNGGVYLVTISGAFPRFYVNNGAFKNYLSDIIQFGSNSYVQLNFYGCTKFTDLSCTDTPDLHLCTSLQQSFRSCSNLATVNNINFWDVKTITNYLECFRLSKFNDELSNWDVANATNFSNMFNSSLFNKYIGGWNVGNVTNFAAMFFGTPFNQDITGWDISSATLISQMFQQAGQFNQNVGVWDVSGVTDFSQFIRSASAFNQSLANWDIRAAATMLEFGRSCNMSVANWNATLIAWDALINPPLNINMTMKPVATGAGLAAKNDLIATWGWTITQGV
jgi:hypothetical protein